MLIKNQNIIKVMMAFIMLILLVSCKVFERPEYALNEAIESEKGFKLKIDDKGPYHFDRLIIIDNQLYGLIPKKSSHKKWLDLNIVDENYLGKYKLIELEENSINDIKFPFSPAEKILVVTLFIGLYLLLTGAFFI